MFRLVAVCLLRCFDCVYLRCCVGRDLLCLIAMIVSYDLFMIVFVGLSCLLRVACVVFSWLGLLVIYFGNVVYCFVLFGICFGGSALLTLFAC